MRYSQLRACSHSDIITTTTSRLFVPRRAKVDSNPVDAPLLGESTMLGDVRGQHADDDDDEDHVQTCLGDEEHDAVSVQGH